MDTIQYGDTELPSPKIDVVFKLLFGDERNIELLTAFLKAVLRLPADEYEEVAISDPHLLRDYVGDKLGILDVKIKTKSKKVINVEIQLWPKSGLRERIIFRLAKMITSQIGSGENYEAVKRSISIFITNFTLIHESGNYHNHYTLYDPESGTEFTDLL
jgi:predicted transposase/invertase (TIGR01784 family)